MSIKEIQKDLKKLADAEKAKILQRFFKTGKGEYGEGDIFLGIVLPRQREIARKYKDLSLKDTQELLRSRIHEHRLTALIILAHKYKKADEKEKKKIFDLYLKNTSNINNWDLVDLSAPNIIGDYLLNKPKDDLYKLAKSKNIWERRISILATASFIRNNKFDDTLKISEILLKDEHDLIHKGVGWMLREIGKRNQAVEERFLKKYCKKMPRTMLRYAIETMKFHSFSMSGMNCAQKPPNNSWNFKHQKPFAYVGACTLMPPISDGWFLTDFQRIRESFILIKNDKKH